MLKNIKEKYGIEVNQLVTFISFIALGYIVIYKFTLMYLLKTEWYIGLIEIQQLILSSLQIIFILIASLSLGLSLIQLRNNSNSYKNAIIISITFIIIVAGIKMKIIEENIGYSILLIIGGAGYIYVYKANDEIKKEQEEREENSRYLKGYLYKIVRMYNVIILIIVFIGIPMIKATREYKNIINNPEEKLGIVKIKENRDEWYLMETGVSTNLLMRKDTLDKKEKIFKIVKTEEIETIKRKNE